MFRIAGAGQDDIDTRFMAAETVGHFGQCLRVAFTQHEIDKIV